MSTENVPREEKSIGWIIAALVIIALVLGGGVLVYQSMQPPQENTPIAPSSPQTSPTTTGGANATSIASPSPAASPSPTNATSPSPTATLSPSPSPSPSPIVNATASPAVRTVTIYAGEMNTTAFGFGGNSSTITSPGPDLTLKSGEAVTVKLVNSSPNVAHNWAIVNAKSSTAPVVFNAVVQSASNPVPPGGTGQVTFVVGDVGSYYYICQVPGHVQLGMWGNVTVTP